ncbi:hypothetical protein [Leifsonia sp. PS1209]|uniref:hypothetical protein n=1 Tax=Leifsonia sp. PS1209 TaxID=2724914 RepID=UPI001442B2BC|nr:hypothetical protein [Leifsonia sp. PS1209]QIZ97801.1 hypothetical protein HF024_04190 [Leifsonia sp. PS1209]
MTAQPDPKQALKLRTANATAQVCPDGATLTKRVVTRPARIFEAALHIATSGLATPADRDGVVPW